eukprot:TRINITY_DN1867_c0_g1_i10.p1 TRINITY_DN1867_c0_g1~~TRINITY_DN1867_c0_g1_i10.p1  ORF type:complete len:814 (+),score=130.57 TRINITY_DN1867_c0_g1_i10:1842-4283(+)
MQNPYQRRAVDYPFSGKIPYLHHGVDYTREENFKATFCSAERNSMDYDTSNSSTPQAVTSSPSLSSTSIATKTDFIASSVDAMDVNPSEYESVPNATTNGGVHEQRNIQRVLFDEIEAYQEREILERAGVTEKIQKMMKEHKYEHTSQAHEQKQATRATPGNSAPYQTGTFLGFPSSLSIAHLRGGITPAVIQQIVDIFQRDGHLDKDVLMILLRMCIQHYQSLGNVNRITHDQVFIKKRTVIVGDLHGQFDDLCYILSVYGSPSDINVYVFNGDYVDRGAKSLEVAVTLLCLGACYPDSVYLNRGNHEMRSVNSQYGFQMELSKKHYDVEVFDLFQSAFNALPFITAVGRDVIVVHGGIAASATSWEAIRSINRFVDSTHRCTILDELLWSDPVSSSGIRPNSRGAGLQFGPDATERFLACLGFTTLIRSHEVKDNGYEVTHNGRCITIFSASNYVGRYGNKGAVAILDHMSRLYMFTYTAADVQGNYKVTITENELEQSNMIYIAELIFEKKPILAEKFREAEQKERRRPTSRLTDLISHKGWIEVMKSTFPLNIPWEWLMNKIAPGAKPGYINYKLFLAQYDLDSEKLKEWEVEITHKVAQVIYTSMASLRDIFLTFDVNGDGTLSYGEFHNAMERMNLGLSKEQITHFIISTDDNMDGTISYDEFSHRFKMKFKKPIGNVSAQEAQEVEELVSKLGSMFVSRSISAKQAFSHFDSDGSGSITFQELAKALNTMFGIVMTPFQTRYLLDILDTDSDNLISYNEFMNAFDIVDIKGNDGGLVSLLASKLFRNRNTLSNAFYFLDRDSSGEL